MHVRLRIPYKNAGKAAATAATSDIHPSLLHHPSSAMQKPVKACVLGASGVLETCLYTASSPLTG